MRGAVCSSPTTISARPPSPGVSFDRSSVRGSFAMSKSPRAALLENLRELRLDRPRAGLDVVVVDGIELELRERRQAGRRRHVDARRMVAFLGELVLDVGLQVVLRKQLGRIR